MRLLQEVMCCIGDHGTTYMVELRFKSLFELVGLRYMIFRHNYVELIQQKPDSRRARVCMYHVD